MRFDFERAKAALAANTAASAFLDDNKARLEALTEEAILAIVSAYLGGRDDAVVTTFYSLDEQAAAMVEGSADVAARQYDFKQRALSAAKLAAQLVISALSAGVLL